MKKYLGIAFLAMALSACQSKNSKTDEKAAVDTENLVPDENAPKVSVEKPVFEFGSIAQGEKVQHEFRFTNTGKSPLIITNASATCGCTVPEFPTQPIKPGESSVIKVIFDSMGKSGLQDKIVTITSNANPSFEKLHLVGDIIVKK